MGPDNILGAHNHRARRSQLDPGNFQQSFAAAPAPSDWAEATDPGSGRQVRLRPPRPTCSAACCREALAFSAVLPENAVGASECTRMIVHSVLVCVQRGLRAIACAIVPPVCHPDGVGRRQYWYNHATEQSSWTAPPGAVAAPPAPPAAAEYTEGWSDEHNQPCWAGLAHGGGLRAVCGRHESYRYLGSHLAEPSGFESARPPRIYFMVPAHCARPQARKTPSWPRSWANFSLL